MFREHVTLWILSRKGQNTISALEGLYTFLDCGLKTTTAVAAPIAPPPALPPCLWFISLEALVTTVNSMLYLLALCLPSLTRM